MSDTDTPDTGSDHAAAIRANIKDLYYAAEDASRPAEMYMNLAIEHLDALVSRLAEAEARVVPEGLHLKGGSGETFPVLWKWHNDWDWRGAATIDEAIKEAERVLWRPAERKEGT